MALAGAAWACGPRDTGRPFVPPAVPAALAEGEALYATHCARCHGVHAAGTDSGPPLVHPIYRPAHHGDESFLLAVRRGVPAHHWRFGDMPAQPAVNDTAIVSIRRYVRWLQEGAGIR